MMTEKPGERERKNNPPATAPAHNLKDLVLTCLIIIGVVAFGLVAINQFLELRYKAELLSTPCDLCLELNPRLEGCFDKALTVTVDKATGEIVNNKIINSFEINFSEP